VTTPLRHGQNYRAGPQPQTPEVKRCWGFFCALKLPYTKSKTIG
jgi:hypothetical protein